MVQSLQALHRADNVYVCTGSQPPRSASGDVLERTFNQGFEQKARTHQIDAVHELLGRIFVGQQRCLPQHAPGSGKTARFACAPPNIATLQEAIFHTHSGVV